MIPCPLCATATTEHHYAEPGASSRGAGDPRAYLRCTRCALIFLDPAQRPSAAEQRRRYEHHRNDASDEGYVRFLRELADPLIARLPPGARGLDYGCGPAPVLASIMESAGHACDSYDPLFAPREELLERRHDFVTCSEVLEHVYDPAHTFALFARLLRDGGMLGVMTRFVDPALPFGEWWYRRDTTHVCFYSEATMRWIAARWDWTVAFPRANVALFTIPASGQEARPSH